MSILGARNDTPEALRYHIRLSYVHQIVLGTIGTLGLKLCIFGVEEIRATVPTVASDLAAILSIGSGVAIHVSSFVVFSLVSASRTGMRRALFRETGAYR